ncbi:type II secretion system protein [Denitrobacterium detoxificans]|uniref:Type IV pilus assembly protein PilC n=1 Tax=Denitrobacterium detoxificans TaxID=79604 RepID=A0A172RW44_9ACTN|nr:type II secretion system F family protein [Denitrobacterium detoxificans]ANE21932.1 type II secretion system protein [Denitrobacterium detoxificans]SEO46123.1 type IV pilus assembly protein PilC [Denitrobacterium detoxificans]
MAQSLLESSALSAFFGSIATMIAAGIQTDEAVLMLAENREESHFKAVCDQVYIGLISGKTLSDAMEETGAFPRYALDMVRTGEHAGRLERVLRSLDLYYDEEHRMFAKLQSSVAYPAALLSIMAIILGFTVAVILPVFVDVYQNMSGSLTAGSFGAVSLSVTIGWAALGVTVVCALAAIALVIASRTEAGRQRVLNLFEGFPSTRQAMYQLALSRFTVALSTYIASGINNEDAMQRAIETVDHVALRKKLKAARNTMVSTDNPRSLAQAIAENDIFEPLYARMLTVGSHSGSIDSVLGRLSQMFFEDTVTQVDKVIDRVEPILAALLTLAVGATLVAVMLPLIGIMGSIG